jgi:hypothetical protein
MESSTEKKWATLTEWFRAPQWHALFILLYLGCATLLILRVPCSLHFHRENGLFMRDDGYLWLWNIGADTVSVTTVFLEELSLLLFIGGLVLCHRLMRSAVRNQEANACAKEDDVDPKVLVWVPTFQGEPWGALATPVGSPLASIDAMTEARFAMCFESRLSRLLLADVEEGRNTLTGSAEHSPDLYTIGCYEPPSAWAQLILQCDQFHTCMNHVDWDTGRYEVRRASELPSLGEIIEQL